jgi:hypothetical protein
MGYFDNSFFIMPPMAFIIAWNYHLGANEVVTEKLIESKIYVQQQKITLSGAQKTQCYHPDNFLLSR